jgi:hypothetical protein
VTVPQTRWRSWSASLHDCWPSPHALPGGQWHLRVALSEADGRTLLTFTQPRLDPAEAESVGPGREYYLDRLAAAHAGKDVAAIDFERDYYPAMAPHYRAALDAPGG